MKRRRQVQRQRLVTVAATPGGQIPGQERRALLLGYFLSFIVLGMSHAATGPALPHLAAKVGASLKGISSLFVAHRLGYLLGSLGGGHLYDRVPGNRLMGAVLLVLGVGLVLVPISPFLALLLAVFLLIGLVEGTIDVGGNVLLVWIRSPRISSLMSALHLFFGVGAFISPLILAQAVRLSDGMRWGYWLLALCVLPVSVLLFRLPSPESRPTAEADRPSAPTLLLPALISLFLFLHVAAEAGYGGWIYTYALNKGLADAVSAGYLTSAFWGCFTLGRLLSVFLALKVRIKHVLSASVVGASLSLALLLIRPEDLAALWVATVCLGLSLAALFPGSITLASEHLPMTGRITGVFLVGSSLGSMTVPWLIGQFFESAGPRVVPLFLFIVVAGSLAVLGAIFALLNNRKQAG